MYQEVVCWQPMVVRVERLKKKHFHCSQQSNSLVWQLVMTCFVFLPTVQLVRRQCCPPQTGDRARQSGRCHRCPRGRDPAPESRGSSPAWNHQHHPCNHCKIIISHIITVMITLWVLRYWYAAPIFCVGCLSKDFPCLSRDLACLSKDLACLSPKSSTPNQKNASLGMTMIDEEERGDHIDLNWKCTIHENYTFLVKLSKRKQHRSRMRSIGRLQC